LRAILGIGNIGSRYNNTRHNVGFMFLDFMADAFQLKFTPSKGDYYYCSGNYDGSDFTLIRPTTYVNNSGIAASHFLETNNLNPNDLLIIQDELNLPFGKYKIKLNGGDGGHNGIASLIYHLNSNEFPRVRIGVGSGFGRGEQVDYVLGKFPANELASLEEIFEKTLTLSKEFIANGLKGFQDANSRLVTAEKNSSQSENN